MASIRPFRATIYDTSVRPDLADVLAPPYDVIGPELQDELYRRDPLNIVRIILGKDDGADRYQRASEYLRDWKARGVLTVTPQPAAYVYRQEFEHEGRRVQRGGFVALLRLDGATRVHPHEVTYDEAKNDRLSLLRACRANFSQIYTLYRDAGHGVARLLDESKSGAPLLQVTDGDGIAHTVWEVTGTEELAQLEAAMLDKEIFIADGHHRFEVANMYAAEMGRGGDADAPYRYTPVLFVDSGDPGLVILPVHRVISGGCDEEMLLRNLAPFFDIRGRAHLDAAGLPPLLEWMEAVEAGRHRFGLITSQGIFRLTLQPDLDLAAVLPAGQSTHWRELDAAILHELGVKRCLGEDVRDMRRITYVTDAAQALELVRSEKGAVAFIMRATNVRQIEAVALAGEKMPPKSSYFHPKPLSGLLNYDHETGL
ncbi:MAG: DUF1015 domain-containing protein [Candidatus Geothermincolia bacterium]